MPFTEVASLDAEVTVALGKKDKNGKPYPKQAEGYYLGSRNVESKRGESKLHFLQTSEGNLGIWGTTDLNRKLGAVNPGVMVRISFTGMKATPNGDMYCYKVEQDKSNSIEVASGDISYPGSSEDDAYYANNGGNDEEAGNEESYSQAPKSATQQRIEGMLKRARTN